MEKRMVVRTEKDMGKKKKRRRDIKISNYRLKARLDESNNNNNNNNKEKRFFRFY